MTATAMATVDLTSGPPTTQPPTPTLVLIYRGSDRPHGINLETNDTATVEPLMSAFHAVQHHWSSVMEHAGRIIVVAPASTALGDADKPLDAAVTGGLISLIRSLAIELERHHATANTILFDTAPDEPAVQVMIAALTHEQARSITGQEIFAGASLGKLHP
ncbi:hypothetical protein ACWDUN_27130 [Mycobacterium sp. NPDC003323]